MRKPVVMSVMFVMGFLAACSAEPEPEPPPERTVTVFADEGGEVESPDGNFVMEVPAQSLVDDTTFTVVQRPAADSFAPDVTLSNVYEVEAEGELAIVFRAALSFAVSAGEVERRGEENLGVAHGERVGELWDEVLKGEHDAEASAYLAETTSLSYFALIDDSEPPQGEVDAGPGDVEPGLCEASCMATSGAVCCEGCGDCNLVEVQCEPVCPAGTVWDCELRCCFDSAETVCVD